MNGHSDICGGWTRTTFDAKAAVTYAASRAHTTLTIRLRSTDESDRDGWRKFSNTDGFPKLIVSYNSPPNVPTNLNTTSPSTSCASSTSRPWVNDNSPVLRATLSSPSNQNLRGRFERQRLASGVWGGTTIHVTSYAAPGVRSDQHTGLVDGQYRWRVRAEDTATQSAYTGYCHFELDTVPPSVPTLAISDPYSLSFWVEPDGRPQATLTVGRGGDTTVDRFRYAIGSGTPTTLQSMSSSTGGPVVTHTYSGDATSYDGTLVVTEDDDATAELTRQVGGEPSVLVVSGPSGRAVTADDPALDVTGELDIRIDLAPDTWTPATRQVIASKGDLTSSQLSWALYIRDGGGVSFRWSFNGTTTPNHFVGWSDPGLSGRTTLRVTITSDGATGAYVTLYVGGSMDGPWDPQWAFHRAEPPTVFASTAPLTIGSNPSVGDSGFSGRIYQFQMYDGATGDLVAEPDFTTQWPQSTGFVDGAGRTWQVIGTSAVIVHQ